MKFQSSLAVLAVLASALVPTGGAFAGDQPYDRVTVERERYLVTISACNDYHTSGGGDGGHPVFRTAV